jgi:small glutamine-rich tetratricopeptide repeat-containing protein alpha
MSGQTNVHFAKRVDFAALEHLLKRCGDVKDQEGAKAVKAAIETLAQALHVDPKSKSDAYKYGTDASLSELVVAGLEKLGSSSHKRVSDSDVFATAKFAKYIESVRKRGVFDNVMENTPEYDAIMEKVKNAFVSKFEPSKPKLTKEDAEKLAETLKLQGNDKLTASDYPGAAALYDQCIELSPDGPNTHIYYSNRAAAYTHLKEFEKAAEDCAAAIALKPDFAKAHSRLGHAFLSLNRFEEAQSAAERALELDATNGVALATLDKIRSLQQTTTTSSRGKAGGRSGAPQMPAGMPRGFPGGMPGMPPGGPAGMDMASMMNNPMVQQMMQDPSMMAMAQQMMSDPSAMANIMNMMGGAGGGGGGRQ